jgi:tRNA-dihydrouridine synthase B
LKIGNVQLKNRFILAPMAGYGDVAFRSLCAYDGAGYTVTEMVSVKGLLYGGDKTLALLRTAPAENPVGVQLFGSEPDEFYAVLRDCEAIQKFDIVDINMGCPVPKVTKQGEGSALMKDTVRAAKIVEACKKATDKPVTVKFRLGWENNTAVEFARAITQAGADAIAVHGRTKEQGYGGKCDLDALERIKVSVSVPMIASGDAKENNIDRYDIFDGVMIGRAALGNPDIFAVLTGRERQNALDLVFAHYDEALKYFDERYVVATMRKHLAFYLKRLSISGEQKSEIILARSVAEVKSLVFDALNKSE